MPIATEGQYIYMVSNTQALLELFEIEAEGTREATSKKT